MISLDLASTATWPRLRCACVAQTLTRCNGPSPCAGLPECRKVLPSMATWPSPSARAQPCSQRNRQLCRPAGARAAKTRSKVLREGMPWGRDRKVCSQSRRWRPKATTWGQSAAPASTAHKAMATMSSSRCFFGRRLVRGSRRVAKQRQIERARSSMTSLQVQDESRSILPFSP